MAKWNHKLYVGDIFHDDDIPFKELRDIIVARILRASWYKNELKQDECSELFYIVDELADTANADEFDPVWDALYDWADANRVWIETWKKQSV